MQADPVAEWQRLSEHYRTLSEGELLELAADFTDLTETAQQALRSEMQSRGLGNPQAPNAAPPSNAIPPSIIPISPGNVRSGVEPGDGVPASVFSRMPQIVPDEPSNDDAAEDTPHEYTWKTALCDCESNDQAQQLSIVLRQSGIDSWIQPSREFSRRYARVLVAADQLEQARVIAARITPREIDGESKEEIPEFVEPKCPKCGSDDVVLDGVDAENHWRCEQCNAQWGDPAEITGDNTQNASGGTL
jgi:ribosomal protein L37AE/L43A